MLKITIRGFSLFVLFSLYMADIFAVNAIATESVFKTISHTIHGHEITYQLKYSPENITFAHKHHSQVQTLDIDISHSALLGLYDFNPRQHQDNCAFNLESCLALATGKELPPMDFDPFSSKIAVALANGTMKILDGKNGSELLTIYNIPRDIIDVSFSKGCEHLALRSKSNTVTIWNSDGCYISEIKNLDNADYVMFSTDASKLIIIPETGYPRIYHADTGALFTVLSKKINTDDKLAFAPDGTCALYISNAGVATLVGSEPGERQQLAVLGNDSSCGFSPDGAKALVYDKSFIDLWDVTSKKQILHVPNGEKIHEPVWNSDGSKLLTYVNGHAIIWDTNRRESIATISAEGHLSHFVFSPDSSKLAAFEKLATEESGRIKIWHLDTKKLLLSVDAFTKNPPLIMFSADSSKLGVPHQEFNYIKIWHLPPDELVALKNHAVGKLTTLIYFDTIEKYINNCNAIDQDPNYIGFINFLKHFWRTKKTTAMIIEMSVFTSLSIPTQNYLNNLIPSRY